MIKITCTSSEWFAQLSRYIELDMFNMLSLKRNDKFLKGRIGIVHYVDTSSWYTLYEDEFGRVYMQPSIPPADGHWLFIGHMKKKGKLMRGSRVFKYSRGSEWVAIVLVNEDLSMVWQDMTMPEKYDPDVCQRFFDEAEQAILTKLEKEGESHVASGE